MFQETSVSKEVQADFPEAKPEQETIKIRPLERVTLHPKAPIEPSLYGKYQNASREWILQDGRGIPGEGSVYRDSFKVPKPQNTITPRPKHAKPGEGVRKRLLRDFFWEQMLDEMIEELATSQPVAEYCSEYDANFVKEDFEPKNLEKTHDKNMHLKFPLYGTGSSAVTFYSETIRKTGPHEILEKFRRCQYFTRPMEERLDDGWVL